ncbi:hypothetical protein M8J75_012469 [Diaphorina citri]|nr:hypothetical protein M8J75_012469 [Diaphorina citri]
MMTKVNINCEQTTGNLSTSLNQWTTPRNENLIKKEQETMTIYDADYIHLNHPPNLFDINKSLILQPRESNILNSSEEKLIIFTLTKRETERKKKELPRLSLYHGWSWEI